MTVAVTAPLLSPRYLGRRMPLRHNNTTRLILWHWSANTGRRRVNRDDCPSCQDGKIEVGDGADNAACFELATYLVRAERGPRAAQELAARFCDEIISYLPQHTDWSLDACSIREWVDDLGRVRGYWADTGVGKASEHILPPDDYQPRPLIHTPLPAAQHTQTVTLDRSKVDAMAAILDQIEDAF